MSDKPYCATCHAPLDARAEIERLTAQVERQRRALENICKTAPWSDFEGHKSCLQLARNALSSDDSK